MYGYDFLTLLENLDVSTMEDMNISIKDLRLMGKIIYEAIHYYLIRHHCSTFFDKKDVVKFRIKNVYIEQSEILTAFGIIVEPRKWKEEFSYCYEGVDFGPLWDLSRMVDKEETWVTVPFSLLSIKKEDDVLEILRDSDKKRARVRYDDNKIKVIESVL